MKKLYSKRRLQLKKIERSGSSAQDVQKVRSALEELPVSSNAPTSGEKASTVNSAGAGMKRMLQSSSGVPAYSPPPYYPPPRAINASVFAPHPPPGRIR